MAKTKKEAKAAEEAKAKKPAAKAAKVKVEIRDIRVEGINEGAEAASPAKAAREISR